MVGADDYLRSLLDQAATEQAFLDGQRRQAQDALTNVSAAPLASAPSMSLMITNQQRAELRDREFSDESIRLMTPVEAHEHLGLSNLIV
jgi:hypothetical protein